MITPSCDHLEKVRNTPHPTTKKQVTSFLGLMIYHKDQLPAFAEISAPLTDLLRRENLNISSGAKHRNMHTPY